MKKIISKFIGAKAKDRTRKKAIKPREGRLCVLVPQRFSPGQVMERITEITGTTKTEEDFLFLSNMGNHFNLEGTHQRPANLYAPLDDSVGSVFVTREFPVLYANDFTTAWLGNLLHRLGAGGELWLEIPDPKANRARNLLTSDFLTKHLPTLKMKQRGDWVEIYADSGLTEGIQKLKTIYPFLTDLSDEFHRLWAKTITPAPPAGAPMQGKALSTYIYSLFGANQKSFIFQKIIDECLGGRIIQGLDLGAGYGFMACELAMQGHTMTAVDNDGLKLETAGKWLVEKASLKSRVSFKTDSIENLPEHEGSYDAISLFGSLLAINKDQVPAVLKSAMQLLSPGGVLLVHENPKEIGTPGTPQYEDRFEAEELLNLLKLHAGKPVFFSMFQAKLIPWRQAKRGVIMAVIAKQS